MKFLSYWIIGFLSFFSWLFMPLIKGPSEPDPVKLINEVICKTGKIIEEKYHVKIIGVGLGMPEGIIRIVGLSIESRDRLSKEQLRVLLIGCAQELLIQINTNQEIQHFLVQTPFTLENVEFNIFNHDKEGYRLYDPEIGVADIQDGTLTYQTHDPDIKYHYKNEFTETYEEALKML